MMQELNYSENTLAKSLNKYERFNFEQHFPGAQVVSYQQDHQDLLQIE